MRKILAIVLMTLMVAGLMMPVAAFEDTAGSPYEEAVNLLYALGIVEGKSSTSYAPEDSLTRAEMVTYALRILGMDSMGQGKRIFEDVTEEHWAYVNIATAYELGLVNGVEENIFLPDEPVTFAQAVKILVNVLGYTLQAEAAGGYPSGYLIQAQRIGLLDGVPQSEDINRGIMALLVANALDINPSTPASYGNDDGRVTILENKTLLTHYMGIETYRGRVTANSIDTVAMSAKTGDGQIALGDLVFSVGKTEAESFIGQNVVIRAKEENDVRTILYVEADGGSSFSTFGNNILPTTSKSRLVLEDEEGKEKVYSIADDAVLVYNGVHKAWTEADLLSDRSVYTFVVDRGSEIGVIFQNRYENRVVKSISEDLKKVYLKDGTNLSLADEEWKKMQLVKEDGSEAKITDVSEWDILSVAISEDGTVLKAAIGKKRVKGIVSELSDNEVVIGEETYKIAKSLSEGGDTKPAVGQDAIFSLDVHGQIAAVNTDTLQENYAYLIAGETKPGLDADTQLKFFTTDGEMKVYAVANKVKLNGAPKDGHEIITAEVISPGGTLKNQLVTYELNSENKIVELNTAENGRIMNRDAKLSVFSEDLDIAESEKGTIGRYIGYGTSALATRYRIADKTIIMVVPENGSSDEKLFAIRSKDDVAHNEEFGNVILYDIDKNNAISVMVHKKAYVSTVAANSYEIGVVDHVTQVLGSEGEISSAIRVVVPEGGVRTLEFGEDVTVENSTFTLTDTSVNPDPYNGSDAMPVSALDKGDIVQFQLDTAGRISAIAVRVRAKYKYEIEKAIYNGRDQRPEPSYNYYNLQYLYGTVAYTVEDGIVVNVPAVRDGMKNERLYSEVATRTLIYDSKKDTIAKMDYTDLVEGDKVAVLRILADLVVVLCYR